MSSIAFSASTRPTSPTYATFLAALHPDDRERVEQAVAKTLKYDTRYNIECRIIRPSGELRHIHCRGIVRRTRRITDQHDRNRAGYYRLQARRIGLAGQRDPNAVDFRERDRRHRRHRRPRTNRNRQRCIVETIGL